MEITTGTGSVMFAHGSKKKQGGGAFSVVFNRTIRLPEDGKTHALPPSLGTFPVKLVDEYKGKVPKAWEKHGGVFVPVHEREALWLGFSHRRLPCAVKVAAGKINAVNGEPWNEELVADVEDYMVAPPQPWLDGFNTGDGFVKQFVAMQLGKGYTVEGQVTGKEDHGGIQLLVIPPKKGAIKPDPGSVLRSTTMVSDTLGEPTGGLISGGGVYTSSLGVASASMGDGAATMDFMEQEQSRSFNKGAEMGLGAGGRMEQKIYPDPHGIDTWNQAAKARLFIHIIDATLYEKITGERPPPSSVSAQAYKGAWFGMDDATEGDIEAPDALKKVKSIGEKDNEHGFEGQQDDSPISEEASVTYKTTTHAKAGVRDGDW